MQLDTDLDDVFPNLYEGGVVEPPFMVKYRHGFWTDIGPVLSNGIPEKLQMERY